MPFLKWVGGKAQIIDDIFKYFPKNMNNYIEPFLGGGSVLIELLNRLEKNEINIKGSIYCSDININLINCYLMIKNNIDKLIDELTLLNDINKFDSIKDKLYYYNRNKYNEINLDNENNKILKASLFIYLNKTCFRGLYRISKNGYNVAYGNYKKVEIFNRDYLIHLSNLFNKYKVNFIAYDFYDIVIKNLNDNDNFIYMDPPYYPISKNSFVNYNYEGFNIHQHNNIIKLCNEIHNSNNKFLLSNSETDYIKNNLINFNQNIILCKRLINSKYTNSTVNELLIYN